jgi:hypothetical protein
LQLAAVSLQALHWRCSHLTEQLRCVLESSALFSTGESARLAFCSYQPLNVVQLPSSPSYRSPLVSPRVHTRSSGCSSGRADAVFEHLKFLAASPSKSMLRAVAMQQTSLVLSLLSPQVQASHTH